MGAILIQGDMMSKPETIELSQDERDALMQRLASNTLTDADRTMLSKCVNFMTWLQSQLASAKINLDKLRKLFNVLPPQRGHTSKK